MTISAVNTGLRSISILWYFARKYQINIRYQSVISIKWSISRQPWFQSILIALHLNDNIIVHVFRDHNVPTFRFKKKLTTSRNNSSFVLDTRSDDLRKTLTYAQYVRPVLQRFCEEWVGDAEDEARWRLRARRVLLELRVVDGEVRSVVAAVPKRSNHTEKQT